MPRRGECIYKRKDGRWEARYVKEILPDGKKKYGSVYAASYQAVKEKQQQVQRSLLAGHQYTPNIRMVNLMANWLDFIEPRVKPATYAKYESLTRNHILPALGNLPVAVVTRVTVEAFARKQREEGRIGGGPLSVKTVNDILIVLKLAFAFARRECNLTAPDIIAFRPERKEPRVLTVKEQGRLVSYLISNMNEFNFCVLLTLYTGLRVGELCALQWDDLTETTLRVDKTMQRLCDAQGGTQLVWGEPKSESSCRVIPVPPFLAEYIRRFRRDSGHLLRTRRRNHSEPRSVQLRFQTLVKKVGLEGVTFHTLRHSYATRCIEAGVDVKTLSEILGHADVKTTLNRYVHSSFVWKQQNIAKLSLPI